MATLDDNYAELGAEFNATLRRTDGEFVAKMLHGRLEQDLRDWFYDRVFRIFDGVPTSEWSEQDQMISEFRCRNEVSCFQSIESAIVARKSDYVSAGNIDWFVDWCVRVNLGPGTDDAKENRLPYYWNEDEKKRIELLSAALADALPQTDYAMFYIHLYGPLLLRATNATVATAFADHATAKAMQAEYDRLDAQVQTVITQVNSGGGTCYIIESDKGLVTTQSSQYGRLFHIWTAQNLAEYMCDEYGEGHNVSPMNYRELGPQLTQMDNYGIEYVTIDRGADDDFCIVPIAKLIQLVQEMIAKIDTSELGSKVGPSFRSICFALMARNLRH